MPEEKINTELLVDTRLLNLTWGEHERNGNIHIEWYFPCGCALHPEPYPHMHLCDEHSK